MKLFKVVSRYWLVAVFLAVLLMVSVTDNVQAQGPVYGGTLRVAIPAEPPGLDPTTNTAAVIDRVVYNNVYEGLVKLSRTGEIVPGVAENLPEISDDGLVWTFRLRHGVKFHDGHELTSADVVYTFKRDKDSQIGVPHPEYYEPIEKIEALDNYTVRITLKEPNSMFLFNLARGDSIIVPNGAGDELKSHPDGTGPFKFVEWVRGDHVTLERFKDYYGTDKDGNKLPYLDKVIIKFILDPSAQIAALKAGDIDVIAYIASPESAVDIASDPRFKVLNGVSTGDVILAINNSRKPFNDLRVRRAISYAINRQEIINGAMFGYGTPIGSHMSPINPNYIDLTWLYPYDPEKAKELLTEAGYPDGFHAVLKLPQPYNYSVRSGKIIADQLRKVGIDLDIQIIDWGQWLSRVFTNADYDLTIIGHAEAFDIGIYANPNYYFRYDSPWFQEVIHRAHLATNPPEQKRWYAIAQWIIASDAVNGFLFEAPSLPAMRKEVMGWWKDYPIISCDMTEVWISPK